MLSFGPPFLYQLIIAAIHRLKAHSGTAALVDLIAIANKKDDISEAGNLLRNRNCGPTMWRFLEQFPVSRKKGIWLGAC
jgi:hypothetical protein